MKTNMLLLLSTCFVTGLVSGCTPNNNKYADLVVYNTIYTAEEENSSTAEAFAVKDGKYVYVGNTEGAKEYIKKGKTTVHNKDNGASLVIPGSTEGHGHYFDGVGLNSQLPGCGLSYEDVLKVVKEQYEKNHIEQFVSFGWETVSLRDRKAEGYNFAKEIEEAAPGIPVVLIDNAGHAAVCNETALQMAGITESTVIRGGEIALDKDGKVSGYIGDQLVFYVVEKAISKPLNDDQYKAACEYGMNELLKLGYTNALDAFTNMYDPTGLYEALHKMDVAKKLKINVAECYNIRSYDSNILKDRVDEVSQIVDDYSSSHLNPRYIKLFIDGVVESGTGWIFGTYAHPQEGKEHGNIIWNQNEIDYIAKYANENNILIHAHSYGDAACDAALNAFIASNTANSKEYRNCLAHVRNIREVDVKRAAENKIPIAANLIWHTDYNEKDPESKMIKEYLIENMGSDYYYSGYPMKSLMDNGVIVSSSTDAPAAMEFPGSVMNIVEVATTGMAPGDDGQVFAPNELLSVKEALQALTINGAWQLGMEQERGSIKVGKYADFVILDKNILNYEGDQLRTIGSTNIINTYFEGQCVYSSSKSEN